jgi:hypothetical protein
MKQLRYDEYMKLIDNIVENEFNHIQETEEREDSLKDPEINTKSKDAEALLLKLLGIAPEHRNLIDQSDGASTTYWTALCRYYFKKGVAAGTANLNFIRDITEGYKFY